MALFRLGKKKAEKENCCCGGNCTAETMEQAENEKIRQQSYFRH